MEPERRLQERRCCPREEVYDLRFSGLEVWIKRVESEMKAMKGWLIGLVMLVIANLAAVITGLMKVGVTGGH